MAETTLTGIDIGSSNIVAIIAKLNTEENTVRVMGFATSESKGVKKGQIVDITQVTRCVEDAIEKAERMAGFKIQHAYVSVGGPHIESINSHGVVAVSNPEVEIVEDDVYRVIDAAKAISLSSTREVIEVIPREFVVDGQGGIKNPVGMSGVRLESKTHIITASMTNLRNIERCLSDLGIKTNSFVFSGLASSLSAVSETEKELGVVLVDIGGGKTDICVYVEGALSYSCSFPIGSKHITNDIAVGLRISLDSAEKIKIKLHQDSKSKLLKTHQETDTIDISSLNLPEELSSISKKSVIEGIIKPRLEEIFEEVMKYVEKSGYISQVPSGLVITGGGALTIGILESAKRVIGMPARIGSPEGIIGLIDEIMYPQYSCAVGLLLYGKTDTLEEGKKDFKDFDRILKNLSVGNPVKKITDLFKSFIP